MKIEKLLRENGVPYLTEGHKHCKEGWINIACPLCTGNPGYHGGFHHENGNYHCWRCGSHKLPTVISALLHCSTWDAVQTIKKYKGRSRVRVELKKRKRISKIQLPGNHPLNKRCEQYLISRKFNLDIVDLWELRYSGPIGEYKHRIIAPIYYDDQIVSYQGRDITGRNKLPYKACKQIDEVRDHNHCIYGSQLISGEEVIVVEGITDAWRMGNNIVAVFGIEFTFAQVTILKQFKRVFVMFDGEKQAQKQAIRLCNCLSAFTSAENITDYGANDPGMLSQKIANNIKKELLS